MATLGELIDERYWVQQEIGLKNAELKELQQEKDAIETRIFRLFQKQDIDSAKGIDGHASTKRSIVPVVEDFDRFWKYVRRRTNMDLIQRNPKIEPWRERLESGVLVPGTKKFTRVSLSVTKRKK